MNTSQNAVAADPIDDADWWRGAVIYQIYPRSFQDDNNDGVGDLRGITRRLPHVASLGVDAIWISPIFTSPMKDFGYDVSNYCDIDPMFGTLADFDALIERAHQLGLRVIIDQVLSHSSDQHPWFTASRRSRDNDKADWYVWADPKPDGTPPNNWLSIFGGSAWQWDSRRQQYYLHNFLKCQPDLNLHTAEVQEALLASCRFWLDRGVDGFRLDTINFFFADALLRDNPALPPELRNEDTAPAVNPYNHQNHLYSKNQPENMEFLRRFRALMDEYGATTSVGEVGEAQRGLEILGEYTAGNERMHMCYAFEFLAKDALTAARLAEVFSVYDAVAAQGWACWAFSNHDVQRHVDRWSLSDEARRLYLLLLLSLRGSVCLYQGEELGLPEATIEFDQLQDPYGLEFWPAYKGRDGCRTPMVWEADQPQAGFSSVATWLPVATEHVALSVDRQEGDADSLLQFYRQAIAMRKSYPTLVKGTQNAVQANGSVASFSRRHLNNEIFCAFNLSGESVTAELPEGNWQVIAEALGSIEADSQGVIKLGPWQFAMAINA
ncbi:MAG: alpha-glucosidase family protein [Granulosicoccus sp.]|nr:alpha-glucosidase family protein [Granulosicoccus sp.]